MSAGKADSSSTHWSLLRSVEIPFVLATVTTVAGTIEYFSHLRTLPAYDGVGTVIMLGEGFFRSVDFLVLAMGSVSGTESLPRLLITLGRASGLLFFFYAAIATLGVLFDGQLKPVRIELWSLLDVLPAIDRQRHALICGVGDEGHALAINLLDDGRRGVIVDTERSYRTAQLACVTHSYLKTMQVTERSLRVVRDSTTRVTSSRPVVTIKRMARLWRQSLASSPRRKAGASWTVRRVLRAHGRGILDTL